MASETQETHRTGACKAVQRQDNFKTIYRLLFAYLKIGYKGEGEMY